MTYTLESLAAEQNSLHLATFTYEFAWELGREIRARAAAEQAPVAIEISHGVDPIFATLLPGATIDNFDWTSRKRAVAHRFHRSSLAIRFEAEKAGFDFNARFRLPAADYVASGGGVPLILRDGTLIGTAAVSGLPDTDDHRLIIESLRALAVRS